MTAYEWLKFGHILLVIVAVGFNASYGVWIARAAREPVHLPHVLRGIKVLDDRFANPAYVLLLLTGLAMVWVGDLDLAVFWLEVSLGLWLLVILGGLFGYTPVLRRQIAALESSGPESEAFRAASRAGAVWGGVLAVLVIVIVFLMVTKPTF